MIVVVDDDSIVRRGLHRLLSKQFDVPVRVFENAEAFVGDVDAVEGARLVITDQEMGRGMKGTELVRHLKAHLPQLPVVVYSGIEVDCTEADGVYRKVVDDEGLTRKLQELMAPPAP